MVHFTATVTLNTMPLTDSRQRRMYCKSSATRQVTANENTKKTLINTAAIGLHCFRII